MYIELLAPILKKIIYISLLLLTCSCIAQKSITEGTKIETENFKSFLEDFSLSKEFQLSRIKFPLSDCKYIGTYATPCRDIAKNEWNYIVLVDTLNPPSTIVDIYDNFQLEMKNSGERVLAFEATETNFCRYYFFKAVEEKWFLIKILTCV